MVPTVPGGAVFMAPSAPLRREKVVQRLKQVGVATCSGLKNGNPGGRVGDEDVQQPVALISAERSDLGCDIDCNRVRPGSNLDRLGLHGSEFAGPREVNQEEAIEGRC